MGNFILTAKFNFMKNQIHIDAEVDLPNYFLICLEMWMNV